MTLDHSVHKSSQAQENSQPQESDQAQDISQPQESSQPNESGQPQESSQPQESGQPQENSQAPAASGPVRLACFEISQEPEKKTDYRQVIQHDDLPQEHRLLLEGHLMDLLRAFAGTPPQGEAVVCFPVHHLGKAHPRFCLCRCRIITRPEVRPFLRLQAVVGSFAHLQAAGIDPLALCYSDVWRHVEWDRCAVHTVQPGSYHVPDPYQSPATGHGGAFTEAGRAREALVSGSHPPLWLDPMPLDHAISGLRQVLSTLEPAEMERARFAVGIPEGCVLPIDPAVIVAESPRTVDVESGQEDGDHGGSLSYAEDPTSYFQQLAATLATDPDIPAAWRHRLWNRCQDVITLLEESRQTGAQVPRGLAECFNRAATALELEMRRAGSRTDHHALRERAARFSETLSPRQESRVVTQDSPVPRINRSKADPTTLAFSVIALVVIWLLVLWLR